MRQFREEIVKQIMESTDKNEVEAIVLKAISELRAHWVCEFVIALFINKLLRDLKEIKGFNDEELLSHIRLLHPAGFQWDL